MISFESDYTTGAHPEILRKLTETNMEMMSGYGSDRYCISAREKIRAACGSQEADVQFLTGGTQTNALVISMMLKDYEGVIAAQTGHINVHEAGAIENTGHKVMTLPQHNGRIDPEELETYVRDYYQDETYEHMVFPGMVYISHPTEYGTLYRRAELEKLSEICSRYNMKLYMDGARLGYGLASLQTDVTLQDITRLCDVFYIGGTKVGALCGEAVVFTRNNTPDHFLNLIKRRGALLAKGRLLGVQFDTLFTDDLYFKISRHAVDKAEELKQIFRDKGYEFFLESPTNQQFVIIGNNKMEKLKEKVAFGFWEKYDGEHTVVRFATSWSTTDQDMEYLRSVL
ncbi:MAG: aminotransferase class I/II-fold pyridoxal phosphate-dependent enzyme [Lentihominibacter sp.]|nr:aminotransferase class I/II-fold pyridoxal phosphate-dependent enzyme [Clostridiales bacterium]MDY2679776.1 aminotransferase class I/II-fold pyridoxal phosphate-dependent enzyme [Lentihominibacter sp.]